MKREFMLTNVGNKYFIEMCLVLEALFDMAYHHELSHACLLLALRGSLQCFDVMCGYCGYNLQVFELPPMQTVQKGGVHACF